MEQLLTRKQIAEKLGVSQQTVKNWTLRKDDPMPSIYVTQYALYRQSDVEEWIKKHKKN